MNINKLLATDTPLSLAGQWVWAGDELAVDVYARFRTRIEIDAPNPGTTITIANTCGEYELWINGRHVGRGGCPSTPEVHFADTHPIGEFLQPGSNVVAILAHGYGTGGQWWTFSPSGLRAEIRAADHLLDATGPHWKASIAPEFSRRAHRFFEILGFAEIVDLRKQECWAAPDFDDASWPPATPCSHLAEHVVIPRETDLPRTTDLPAHLTHSGRALCPEGIQTIPLARIISREGPGTYRLTSSAMSPGVDATLEILGDCDYLVRLNGEEVARHYFRYTYGGRYTEQRFHEIHPWSDERPPTLHLPPGWNDFEIQLQADERTSHIALRLVGTFVKNTMPFLFSAARDLHRPGWCVQKIGGTQHTVTALPPLQPPEVLSSWGISIPDRQPPSTAGKLKIRPGRYAIFDLGRVVGARPAIDISASAGTVLDLHYGEYVTDFHNLLMAGGDKFVDRIVCHDGRQSYETVARRGLRYVKVHNRRGGEVIIHRIAAKMEKVVGPPQGSFQCSNPRLNEIYKVCLDTLDASLNYHPVDCPTRENGQYPGDNFVEVQQMFYLFDDLRLSRKGIRQFPRVQEPSGFFPGMTPAEWRHSLTDYSLIWVCWLADHYLHTADAPLVREMLPYIERLFGFFHSIKDDRHGLPRRTSDEHFWLFLDHSPIDRRGIVCGYAAWYACALERAAWMAQHIGRHDLSRQWADEAEQVRTAARNLFWDPALGLFHDCFADGALSPSITFQTNIIALFTGLPTPEQAAAMIPNLWRPDGSPIQPELTMMNPYFQHYVLEALALTGNYDRGLEHILAYWGLMLDLGATTNWECFQSTGPVVPTSSLCHPWSGAPAYWLPAYVLGVKPAAPGWARAVVRPKALNGIYWARGTVPTPRGPITVEWKHRDNHLDLHCHAPDGVEIIR